MSVSNQLDGQIQLSTISCNHWHVMLRTLMQVTSFGWALLELLPHMVGDCSTEPIPRKQQVANNFIASCMTWSGLGCKAGANWANTNMYKASSRPSEFAQMALNTDLIIPAAGQRLKPAMHMFGTIGNTGAGPYTTSSTVVNVQNRCEPRRDGKLTSLLCILDSKR